MVLRFHFCLLVFPKFDLGDVEKAIFQWVDRTCKMIFFLLAVPKCDMGELQKALILVFPPSSEVTLCLLAR
jgi:hypothetical protein